jgi:hypothetical protein
VREGIAAGVLEILGVNPEKARRETLRVLGQSDGPAGVSKGQSLSARPPI